jgi:N-acyl homoserine lactone hydrolase
LGHWRIDVLYYGMIRIPKSALTVGFDPDLIIDLPYLGFLLRHGNRNVLVDSGISAKFIVDGKAWGGYPAEGGKDFVIEALGKEGLTPADIDIVIYTHLHNDHAGNCELFPKASFIVQQAEWEALLDPIPVERVRGDYDQSIIPILAAAKMHKIDGDLPLLQGIHIYKTPGHTRGSQVIAVDTEDGRCVLCGDTCHALVNIFPHLTEMVDMEGRAHKITVPPEVYRTGLPSSLVYDYYDWYKSLDKIKALAEQYDPAYVITGHDPSLISLGIKGFAGK